MKVTSTDFEFDVHISLEEFSEFLHKELKVSVESGKFSSWSPQQRQAYLEGNLQGIISVHNVSMSGLSTANLGVGTNPVFDMDYDFLGHHHFSIGLPLLEFYGGFHDFYLKYLEHLFQ